MYSEASTLEKANKNAITYWSHNQCDSDKKGVSGNLRLTTNKGKRTHSFHFPLKQLWNSGVEYGTPRITQTPAWLEGNNLIDKTSSMVFADLFQLGLRFKENNRGLIFSPLFVQVSI